MIAWHGIFQMLGRVSFSSRRPVMWYEQSSYFNASHLYRREQKETLSSIWKIPCRAIMFGVSEKRPSSN
ncbi:hypothetical protein T12_9381 [Trichinella patagoniensis]|uniref:Uncharacterized protein n=1 Tax=Trichinella patagoniensis TaxID=990121 RepID=A0A0V0YZ56_9BILA|nr:hypothetical protein T12_9381 [Trichinella patagoniensis]